jgi:prepilin-type N-terminal cleavage/methylation domain-containing protein
MTIKNNKKGFTLIEFLIVIGIMVLLSAILVISISPGQQMQKARDNKREAHISAIYLALIEYKSKEGDYPACVGTTESDASSCSGDLNPDYIFETPEDPDSDCEYTTGYFIKKDATTDLLGVKAMCAEGEEEITVGNW